MKSNPHYSSFEIGEHTYGKPRILYMNGAKLRIGKYCSIAEGVKIFLGGEHRVDWVTAYPFSAIKPEFQYIEGHPSSKGDVVIGNDVWIASDAIILSGVTIGDGAVVGARSVITNDVEPYAIVAGNPARFIRHRFSETQIEALLEIAWWNWMPTKINASMSLLLSPNIEEFIEKYR